MNSCPDGTASVLEALLGQGEFVVTAEVVPPKSANGDAVVQQARMLVGYADAVNVTDNPTASAHMSAVAGAALVARAGLEPTLQLQLRDRNRLALTGELLGGWALGARNVLCLTGDAVGVGDHPDASEVHDVDVRTAIGLVRSLRDEGRLLSGATIEDPPRYFVGAADAPFASGYDPGRLEAKIDAGAQFVQTQIAYDADAVGEWLDVLHARGVTERAYVLVGVAPLRSVRQAAYVNKHLAGVVVPEAVLRALKEGGDAAGQATAGIQACAETVLALRGIEGVAGVHVMGLGHEEAVLRVVEAAGLLPRPTP